ncbi:Hypothetical Protein RradSPS_0848 [Rubrobacter radiotolerans]|uniref:Alpha/beta hydrolase n=1 Tax=Rubrobacter radiotolerans TaxID=42256 RepID=A0A023X1R6_RUBRA|nr:alpha/beta hydrolase [Rubrobacter radiotolerans]AHY46131.1 Hypothetical Protein RradSPS_0848 [Rubrobacter radiotolerans]MDX5893541.1 alpha/beta hydrolase [Rubrobacter radiotolerans]SMC03950.1 esterase/lipase/thioesterase family protein [Rubrobacter radiotolerans DSM 5868]
MDREETGGGALEKNPPVVIVGGFLSWPKRYRPMAEAIRELSGLEVHITPLTPADWLGVLAFGKPGQLVFEIATAVDKALLGSESKTAILVGHSAGGVASRVYLGGDPPFGGRRYSGHRRVSDLITLGSPHLTRDRWPLSLLHRAQKLFPDALHETIAYRSVAGAALPGEGNRRASLAYRTIAGRKDLAGDGVVPVESALLPGSESVVLDDLVHDPHQKRGLKWYGSDLETVARWWPERLRRRSPERAASRTGGV